MNFPRTLLKNHAVSIVITKKLYLCMVLKADIVPPSYRNMIRYAHIWVVLM